MFDSIDKDKLIVKLTEELPLISGEMNSSPSDIAWRTGLDKNRVSLIVSGKRKMKWSEYMSILFLLWDDEKGRKLVDERGLFPDTLKQSMALNKNAHGGV